MPHIQCVSFPSSCAFLRLIFLCFILLSNVLCEYCIHMSQDVGTEFFKFVYYLNQFFLLKINTNDEQILAFAVSVVKDKSELILRIRWLLPQNVLLKIQPYQHVLEPFSFIKISFLKECNLPSASYEVVRPDSLILEEPDWLAPIFFHSPFLLWNAQSCEHGPQSDMLERIN